MDEQTYEERAEKIRKMIMGNTPANHTENAIKRILGERGQMKNFESYIPPKIDRESKIREMLKI